MKCTHIDIPCIIREGQQCKMDCCMLDKSNPLPQVKKIIKCPLTSKQCVNDCAWFDEDNNRCVIWRLAKSETMR